MRGLVMLLVVGACHGDAAPPPRTFGGDRPVDLQLPATTPDNKHPLVIVLHGYSVDGFIQQAYLGLKQLPDTDEAFMIWPDGLYNSQDKPYWNADPTCCDFEHSGVDDVAYLDGLIQDIGNSWPIDRDAVFLVGQGNGGNMAYRMACDHAEDIAAIVVLGAGTAIDATACQPAKPVSVLHLHGTADAEFSYEGNGWFQMSPGAPGAIATTTRWAGYDGCDATRTPGTALDLDSVVDGAETHPETFGCPSSIGVELWTMQGSEHLPGMTSTFVPAIWPWLLDHRR
jgi:polyhydroxybutyrate depolymerase